jgi:hypothetical protein
MQGHGQKQIHPRWSNAGSSTRKPCILYDAVFLAWWRSWVGCMQHVKAGWTSAPRQEPVLITAEASRRVPDHQQHVARIFSMRITKKASVPILQDVKTEVDDSISGQRAATLEEDEKDIKPRFAEIPVVFVCHEIPCCQTRDIALCRVGKTTAVLEPRRSMSSDRKSKAMRKERNYPNTYPTSACSSSAHRTTICATGEVRQPLSVAPHTCRAEKQSGGLGTCTWS